MKDRCCETCQWWTGEDPSVKEIGNVRLCTWALPRSKDFYGKTTHAPFWASKLTHSTVSYEGTTCGSWKKRKSKTKKGTK